jgi:UDP-glucose 4-epimerase
MSRVLVTGGAGFIGSALSRHLSTSTEVVVLDDLSSGNKANLDGVDVEFHEGSILDRNLVERLIADVETVYHLACKGVRHSIHQPHANHEVNATGTLNLLEAARQAGVKRFVYTSTSEVYGTAIQAPMVEDHPTYPHTVYGGAKLAGEAYTRAYHRTHGLETIVIRPFNSFGPRSHHEGDSGEVIPKFIVRAMNGLPPIIFGDGSQTRDFTYVDDTAAGIAAAADTDALVGVTVNLGSGREVRIDELARIVLRIVDREDLVPIHDDPRPGDVLRLIADSSMARSEMNWRPEVDMEQGIRQLIDWHDEQGTDWSLALTQDSKRNWEPAE